MKLNQNKIEKAISVLDGFAKNFPDGFPKEMKGDISSFGASIIQAGILPTVIFYSEGDFKARFSRNNSDDDTKNRRALLMKVILDVMEPTGNDSISEMRPLLDYVRNHLNDRALLGTITEAALAIKMALRVFKLDEGKQNSTPNSSPETSNPTI